MFELSNGESRVITLRMAWTEYRNYRQIKPLTIESYQGNLNRYLGDWLDLPIELISKSLVLQRHAELTHKYSGTTANCAMRIARAVIEFAICRYDLPIAKNPIKVLSHLRAWNREKPRKGHIPEEKFPQWYQSVQADRNKTARDYLRFLKLTGLRRQEAAALEWKLVDLHRGCLLVEETKNSEELFLPLATYTWNLLQRRREENPESRYVFNSKNDTPFGVPLLTVRRIEWEIGIPFTPHDLRRTFLTVGDSLDIPLHVLKQLCNHKLPSDITLRYIQTNVNRLREPSERIADRITKLWGINT